MSTTETDVPGLDPEVRDLLAIVGSPLTFMEHASRGKHRRARHLVYLADRILAKLAAGRPMEAEPGDQQFLACYIPVRHGKSFFTGRYLAPWLMGVFPGIQILFVTYSDDRAERWGAAARDLMAEWAPTLFGCTVSRTDNSAAHWSLSNGSTMRCVGMGGSIVGEGAQVVIIDDTLKKPEEADSPTVKRKQVEWYYETLRNRLEPGGLIICCVARWREDDLPGSVCIPAAEDEAGLVDEWEIIRLPALAEMPKIEPPDPPPDVPEPEAGWAEDVEKWVEKWKADWVDDWIEQFREDWRDELGRQEGEALWPERWPRKLLEKMRSALLKRGQDVAWDALYQQNPTPKEGGSFKVEMWRSIGKAPDLQLTVRTWDLSASLRKGDWTVGVKMGLGFNNEVYILNVVRARLDPAGVQNLVVTTAEQDGYDVIIGMEEETGASGKANTATFAMKLLGYQFHSESVSGKKDVRAAGYAAHQGNGLVYLVKDGTWDDAGFIEEHRVFGAGRHDDQVDAAALGFRMLALGGFGPGSASVQMPEDDLTAIARMALGRMDPLAQMRGRRQGASEEVEGDDVDDKLMALMDRVSGQVPVG